MKGVHRFLGHAGFYRRFIKDFSLVARPLTCLLAKDDPFNLFIDECSLPFKHTERSSHHLSANHSTH